MHPQAAGGDESGLGGARKPFVGRAREVGVIDQMLDEVQAGLGCSLVLTGEAGIGKSVLVDEALRRARVRGFRTARAYCAPIDGQALAPVADVLGGLRGADGGDHVGDLSLRAAAGALQRASQTVPLLLIIEDVHWAAPSAIAGIDWLARQSRDLQVAWISTVRTPALGQAATSDYDAAGLLHTPGARHVVVQGLTEAEVGALIEASHGHAFDRDEVATIHLRSGGNPLLAEELSRAVARGESDLTPLVSKLFGDALGGIEGAARHVLTICGVAGGSIRYELLQRVGSAMSIDVGTGVQAALRNGVLVRRPGLSAYACRHPLLADVAGAAIDSAVAQRMHEALADEIEIEPGLALSSPAAEIAHHRSRAGDDARTLPALIAAADEADALNAPTSILVHLEKAIQLYPRVEESSAPPLGALLTRAAYAAEVVGRNRDAVRLARQSLSADDASGPELGTRYLLLAEMLRRGRHSQTEADAAVERASELIGDDKGPAALQLEVARSWHWDTDPQTAIVHGRRAIEQAEAMSAAPLLAQALVLTGGAMTILGDVDDGTALARRGRSVATEAGFEIGALTSYVPIGAMHVFAGFPSRGADELLAGLQRCIGGTDTETLRAALAGWAAYALFCAGRWAEASDLAIEAEADGIYAALLPLTSARLFAFQGKTESATEVLEQVADRGAVVDPHHVLSSAWTAWCSGDTTHAHRLAVDALASDGLPAQIANELSFLRVLCRPSRDTFGLLPRLVEPEHAPVIARLWAVSARAAVVDDEATWREALDCWRQSQGWPHMNVICSTRLAARTDAGHARELLTDGLAIARDLASPVLVSCVTTAAASLQLNLEASRESAEPQLTPREQEVLGHLATGASNRQMARTLGISEGTVSVHVSNLLRKLDVASRTEAALAAARGLVR